MSINYAPKPKNISFITEDALLYGARGLQLNSDAVKKLFKSAVDLAERYGVSKKWDFRMYPALRH